MSKVLIIPGSPSQWSRCRWVMKIASSSGSPMLRRSWCCVPSPQSNRIRSPPARSRIAGRPRLGVGTLPAVPAKKSETSIGPARLAGADTRHFVAGRAERRVPPRVLRARGRALVAGSVDLDDDAGIWPVEVDLDRAVDQHAVPLILGQPGEERVLLRAARAGATAQVQLDRFLEPLEVVA